MFYVIMKHAHSGLRWLLLIFILEVLILSIYKLSTNKEYRRFDKSAGLYLMSVAHLQLILGLVLYFLSPKVVFSADTMGNAMLRFFAVEHVLMMVISLVLITIGYSKVKKASSSRLKHKRSIIFYGIALLLILLAIPWPWQQYAAAWF